MELIIVPSGHLGKQATGTEAAAAVPATVLPSGHPWPPGQAPLTQALALPRKPDPPCPSGAKLSHCVTHLPFSPGSTAGVLEVGF